MTIFPQDCDCIQRCELQEIFAFQTEQQYDARNLCAQKTEKQFEKGEIIFKEGDLITDFIYLKTGLVKLSRLDSFQNEQIISIAQPFDFISLLSVFSSKTYNYTVTAIEDSVTCNIDMKVVKLFAKQHNEFVLNILEKMSRTTDKLILTILDIKQKRLNGRIAWLLLFFADEIYKNNVFDIPLSRKEMASFIGMTTENVIRSLSSFRNDKIINTDTKRIEILDKERLQQIYKLS